MEWEGEQESSGVGEGTTGCVSTGHWQHAGTHRTGSHGEEGGHPALAMVNDPQQDWARTTERIRMELLHQETKGGTNTTNR